MDYSKLKRNDLLKLCLEKDIQGCSNKKKNYIISKLKALDDQEPNQNNNQKDESKEIVKSAPTYTIINSSCIEGLQTLKEASTKVHLTVTSPPYFNVKEYVSYDSYSTYLNTLETVFKLVYDITHDGRMCCVNISNILIQRESRSKESKRIPLAFHFVALMEKIGWKFIEDIIWIKPEGSAKNRNGGFFQHRQPVAYKPNIVNEYIFIFQKPSKFLIDKIVRSYDPTISQQSKVSAEYERTNVWKIQPETKSKHPAPYPEELVNRLVNYYSYVGDTVLDPFLGSGTTSVSAYKLQRNSIGFEIHEKYITLAHDRIKKLNPPVNNE